jgi:REP element-mobilizing transposase RayT
MSNTLGVHWIATTHGTWLHGDPRGSWQKGKLIGPDPFLEQTINRRMAHDAVLLDDAERKTVAARFGATCVECKYRVYAMTVRPVHVHVVFGPLPEEINTVIARLKRRSAADVLAVRRQMKRAVPRSLWTAGRFPIFIFDEDHLRNAIEYVRQHNLRVGLAADPYDWIDPLDGPYASGEEPGQHGPAI